MTENLPQPFQNFREGGTKTSLALFANAPVVFVDQEMIDQLKVLSKARGSINTRLCLHGGPEAKDHDMIIVEYDDGRYYRPHRHGGKAETLHIIEGEILVISFADGGKIERAQILGSGGVSFARIDAGIYHTVFPLTKRVIYHESKSGPFLGDADSIPAPWSPDGSDKITTDAYVASLMKAAE
jgi:cupin fold WbuC family metalloprotein